MNIFLILYLKLNYINLNQFKKNFKILFFKDSSTFEKNKRKFVQESIN